MSYVMAYVFECEDCRSRLTVDIHRAADLRAAERMIRRCGWAANHGRHRCPEHRETGSRRGEAGRAARHANRLARIEDYAELRSWGHTPQQAAWRLGVSRRTAVRYEATLRGAA